MLGRGEAPNQALGLNYDSGVLVPFGTLGHHLVEGSKRDAKNELVVILGLSHDGPGYRAIKVSDGEVIRIGWRNTLPVARYTPPNGYRRPCGSPSSKGP